jgi:tetratricopeptide (TPR) repeat protein
MLLLIVQSCAAVRGWVSPQKNPESHKRPVQTATHPKQSSPVPDRASVQSADLAKQSMDSGEYQKAIELYNDASRKQPQDLSLMKEYAKSLDGIKSAADKSLQKGDLASAGKLYNVLQNNYTKFNRFENMLSFNKTYLNTKLAYCRKTLSKQGFEEYRKGNLNKAIMLWQGLLVIDPNNKDIKEAVRTATQQQKNLQEKD